MREPATVSEPPTPRGPLDGVRVIEAGTLIAGPFCGQLLGDFGAEVIEVGIRRKVTPCGSGAPTPVAGPVVAGDRAQQAFGHLQPARRRGQRLVRELVARADVLVENFRPGTLERWDLGVDELHRIKPRLVLVRVTGYGQTGPYAHRAGFGSVGEAMGGLRYVTGEPDRPPSRTGISIGDSLAGTFAALGAVMALFARQTTGSGQVVDSAIYEAVLAMMECLLPEWEIGGIRRERTGAVLPGLAPSNVYPSAEGAEVLIAANRDTVFERLCTAMDRPELAADPRFADHHARGRHAASSTRSSRTGRAACPPKSCCTACTRAMSRPGWPTPRRTYSPTSTSPRERRWCGWCTARGGSPRTERGAEAVGTPGRVARLGPELGEDNDTVYGGLLGIDAAELGRLGGRGVV